MGVWASKGSFCAKGRWASGVRKPQNLVGFGAVVRFRLGCNRGQPGWLRVLQSPRTRLVPTATIDMGHHRSAKPRLVWLHLGIVPIRLTQGRRLMGRALKGCRPYPLGAMPQTPLFIMGFGADGPKKRVGRGVQPRSAKPRACLNRIGTMVNIKEG